jgi:hypothetical protein
LVQQHAATFIAETEAAAGADLPQFVKDEFDAFLECGILAHGFLRLRCGDCGHDKLVTSVASGAAFARRAARGAWHRRRRTIPQRFDAQDVQAALAARDVQIEALKARLAQFEAASEDD